MIRRASRSTVAHCGVLVESAGPGVWRSHEGLRRSHELLGQGYDWGEITRIAGHLLHLPPLQRLGLALSRPDRLICSNHCASVVLAGRPGVPLPFPPDRIWPAPLLTALEALP